MPVIKKVKIKKAVDASKQVPIVDKPISIEDELKDIKIDFFPVNESEKIHEVGGANDEFDKLLQEFISSDFDDYETLYEETPTITPAPKTDEENIYNGLKAEEKSLFTAYIGFVEAVNILAETEGLARINPSINAGSLMPNYKPSTGRKIVDDTVKCWKILLKIKPEDLKNLNINSSDDELLDFAEACDDNNLTLAIISYVETLIEMEGCEISYLEKSQKAKRKLVERIIIEEHNRRLERNKRFISAIEKKKFPINAERLITNYFKTSQKDPEGAFKALTHNPAMFAPIEVNKIEPSFFGLIKPTPKDGIKINRKLGDFLKKIEA